MKTRFFRRVTAFTIAFLMALGVFSVLPEECLLSISTKVNAIESNSENNIVASGYCGDESEDNGKNVTWVLNSAGVLNISGIGKIKGWRQSGYSPWNEYKEVITEIIINSGITSIEDYAFISFRNLKSISIPDGVTSIGKCVFESCYNLANVTIPSSVISIGYRAFRYCSNLSNITIAEGVTSISDGAFRDCDGLISIKIPNSVTSIGNEAFYDCINLVNITIPYGVTSIGYSAFLGCKKLKSISIPNSITKIGGAAFGGCDNFTSIIIPNSVTEIGGAAFNSCDNLTDITLSSGITSISDYLFSGCKSLKSVEIPYGVETIGAGVFGLCTNLESITIPSSVTYISASAFTEYGEKCEKLTIYGYTNSYAEIYARENNIPFVALSDDNAEIIFNNHRYKLFDTSMTWDEAKAYCENLGGHLLTITSADEQAAITSLAQKSTKKNIWLGAEIISDNFVWITGEAFDYINWNTGEPNNIFNSQNTIMMYTYSGKNSDGYTIVPGVWNDENKNGRNWSGYTVNDTGFICEWDNEETDDDNTDTSSDSRYDYLALVFKPENLSYTYSANTESFNAASTECEINLSCINLLQNGLFMDINKIVVTPPKGFSVNGLDEGAPLEYTYIIPEPINGGSDGDIGEHFVLYTPTKDFLKSNPITESSTEELTITVYGDDDFVKTFKQSFNVKYISSEPTYDEDTYTLYYIIKHYFSAKNGEWRNLTQTSDIKKQLENSSTEWAQVASQYEQYGVKLFSLNPIGIYNQYSLNEYDAILLDMFYSTEGLDKADSIFDMSLLKSEETAIKTIQKFMKAEKIVEFSSDAEYYEFSKKLYQLAYSIGSVSDSDIEKLLSESGYSYNNVKVMNHNIALAGTMDAWEALSNALNKIGITVTTFKDFLDNINTIVNARALYNMKEEYKTILDEIKVESQKYNGNGWEIKDLQNALDNQIEYYEKNFFNDAWECFKTAYEASDGTVKIFTNKSIPEYVTGISIKTILSNVIARYLGDDVISSLAASSGITGVTSAEVKKGITFGAKVVGKYIGAVSLGVSIGDALNQLLFSQNTNTQLYYKAKCYAVLEDILYVVLNNKADELVRLINVNSTTDEFDELINLISTNSDVSKQYTAAIKYDKAFKMYMFTEANGLMTYGEYEKTFVTEEIIDGDTIIDKILKKFKEVGNAITEGVEFYAKAIQFGSFDKSAQDILEKRMLHLTNSTILQANGDYILENCKCHDEYSIGSKKFNDAFGMYKSIKDIKSKLAIINCPVEVSAYDSLGNLIGTLSSEGSNVKSGYEIYMYRIESTDSNVVILPDNYTIKIKGLKQGTMDIISMYCNGNEAINGTYYYDIPVDSNYEAELIINSNRIDLYENNNNNEHLPINPSTTQNVDSVKPTNTVISTTFNVKVENKITNKTTKVKATRTGENVTINLGKDNNGYYANVYTSDGKLLDAVKIKSGKAKFTIPNDNDFYIIVDEASHLDYEDVSSGAGIHDLLNEPTTSLCIIAIIIIAVAGSLTIVAIKRFAKNKH